MFFAECSFRQSQKMNLRRKGGFGQFQKERQKVRKTVFFAHFLALFLDWRTPHFLLSLIFWLFGLCGPHLSLSHRHLLSGPLRLRVQSRSRTRLRIAASIAFLFRACFHPNGTAPAIRVTSGLRGLVCRAPLAKASGLKEHPWQSAWEWHVMLIMLRIR